MASQLNGIVSYPERPERPERPSARSAPSAPEGPGRAAPARITSTTSAMNSSVIGRWPSSSRCSAAPKNRSSTTSRSTEGGDLAAGDGPVQHDPVLCAQRFEHPVPPGPAQLRVVLRLGDQPGQHRPHRCLGDRPHPRAQRREHVTAQRPGIGLRLLLAKRGDERVQREQPLGRPAPVDRRLADPGPGGHLLDRHRGQPPFGQQFHGRGQDGSVRLLAPRPPARRRTPRPGTSGTPRPGTSRHPPARHQRHRTAAAPPGISLLIGWFYPEDIRNDP